MGVVVREGQSFPRSQAVGQARGKGLKLHQGKFRFYIRENFVAEGFINLWNRLPREVAASPSLELFKRHIDVALRVMV